MIEDPIIIKWKRWDSDELTKCMDPYIETGTKYQCLKVPGDDMKYLALHSFNMQWNYGQFKYIKDPETLEYGHLVQVMDFRKYYLNQFQDEPQSLFWYHTQTAIHPIINYCRCPQCPNKIVTDEYIIISDNRKHDKQAVGTFEEASLGFIASTGIVPSKKVQFLITVHNSIKADGASTTCPNLVFPQSDTTLVPSTVKAQLMAVLDKLKVLQQGVYTTEKL